MSNDYPEPPQPPMAGGGSPEPPVVDAEVIAAQSKDESAPQAEAAAEPGKFKMAMIKTGKAIGKAADTVVRSTAFAIIIAFAFVADKVSWLYCRTAQPVLKWIERWIPGMGELRTSLQLFVMMLLITGALVGGIIAAEAGLGFFASLGLIGYAMVYLPYLVVITPSVWISALVDIVIISVTLNLCYTMVDTIVVGKGMFQSLARRMWPGMVDYVNSKPAKEVATAPAAA